MKKKLTELEALDLSIKLWDYLAAKGAQVGGELSSTKVTWLEERGQIDVINSCPLCDFYLPAGATGVFSPFQCVECPLYKVEGKSCIEITSAWRRVVTAWHFEGAAERAEAADYLLSKLQAAKKQFFPAEEWVDVTKECTTRIIDYGDEGNAILVEHNGLYICAFGIDSVCTYFGSTKPRHNAACGTSHYGYVVEEGGQELAGEPITLFRVWKQVR